MYYGRKKAITIAIIAAVVVVVLIVAGIIIGTTTDLFKSNKTLFWKYAKTAFERNSDLSINQIKEFEKAKQDSPYTSTIKVEGEATDTTLNQALSQVNIEVESQIDHANEYARVTPKIMVNNNSLIDLDYVHYNDIYAVKSNEIVNAYLGVRNENLKVLAQKLGYTNTESIPDSIPKVNTGNILDIPADTLTHIKEAYLEIASNNILDKNYSKQTGAIIQKDGETYKTTSYRLDLSANDVSMILSKMLQYLKTDSVTMNFLVSKAKELNLDEKYTSISGMQDYIDELITEVESKQFDDVSIVVYNYKGQTVSTEVIVKNKSKTTIYNENGKITITEEDLTGESEVGEITIQITYSISTSMSNYGLSVAVDDVEYLSAGLTCNGSATSGRMNSELTLTFLRDEQKNETMTYTISYEAELVDELEETIVLDQNNSGILNDFTQEQLAELMPALINRTNEVINEKTLVLGGLINALYTTGNSTSLDQSTESLVGPVADESSASSTGTTSSNSGVINSDLVMTYNARFEAYKGLITGTNLKTLKILVQNNNQAVDTDNTITMTIDGTIIQDESDNSMIDANTNYDVQMKYGASGMINTIIATKKL